VKKTEELNGKPVFERWNNSSSRSEVLINILAQVDQLTGRFAFMRLEARMDRMFRLLQEQQNVFQEDPNSRDNSLLVDDLLYDPDEILREMAPRSRRLGELGIAIDILDNVAGLAPVPGTYHTFLNI